MEISRGALWAISPYDSHNVYNVEMRAHCGSHARGVHYGLEAHWIT